MIVDLSTHRLCVIELTPYSHVKNVIKKLCGYIHKISGIL